MRTFCLDGAQVADPETLHSLLAEGLEFPGWYGGNLDALYDCLTDCDDELELTVTDAAALERALGDYADRFFRVLEDAAAENDCLHVTVD